MSLDHSKRSEVNLIRENTLLNNLVLVDGIGSSGKGMLSHLIASFKRVEKQSNHTVFDYIAYMHWLKKISDDAAITYLQIEADMQLYHISMSRDVNFRFFDSTGVLQNPHSFRYFSRLFRSEGDSVVEQIKKSNPILNEAPHDALRNARLFFDAFDKKVKILYMLRNPLEIMTDWVNRGFGHRIGSDPREFQLTFLKDGNVTPLFFLESDLNFVDLNLHERVVVMINFCITHNLRGYEALNQSEKKYVKIIPFENLTTDPIKTLEHLAYFLQTEFTKHTRRAIKHENLPRKRVDIENFEVEFFNKIRPEIKYLYDDTFLKYNNFRKYTV